MTARPFFEAPRRRALRPAINHVRIKAHGLPRAATFVNIYYAP
jgi:hypothetical protein